MGARRRRRARARSSAAAAAATDGWRGCCGSGCISSSSSAHRRRLRRRPAWYHTGDCPAGVGDHPPGLAAGGARAGPQHACHSKQATQRGKARRSCKGALHQTPAPGWRRTAGAALQGDATTPTAACCCAMAAWGVACPLPYPAQLRPPCIPLQKRCKFTEQAVEAAGLGNVRVHWGRAEDAGALWAGAPASWECCCAAHLRLRSTAATLPNPITLGYSQRPTARTSACSRRGSHSGQGAWTVPVLRATRYTR